MSCLRLPFAKARWCVLNWLGVCTFFSYEAGSWSRSGLARAEGDGASLLCHGNFGSPQWPALGSVYSKPEWSGKAPVAVTLGRVRDFFGKHIYRSSSPLRHTTQLTLKCQAGTTPSGTLLYGSIPGMGPTPEDLLIYIYTGFPSVPKNDNPSFHSGF